MTIENKEEGDFCFRTLNYLGSKLRILDFIEEHVLRVTPANAGVCDLFAGSGCVSYRLSSRFPVTACDIQHYSTILCNALLNPVGNAAATDFLAMLQHMAETRLEEAFSPMIQKECKAIAEMDLDVLAAIIEHGSIEVFRRERKMSSISNAQETVLSSLDAAGLDGSESFISRNYGGVYFSYKQAVQIDTILSAIRNNTTSSERDLFLAALLSTASDIVDTVGKHFAQPIKTRDAKGNIKPLVYNKAVKDKTIDVLKLYGRWLQKYLDLPRGRFANKTIQGDYMHCLEMLTDEVCTVYADPPYTREHYSRFYHVLETMALGDTPQISTVKIRGSIHVSNGLYRCDRHQSPFCIRSMAPKAFDDMFKAVSLSRRNLLLSYSPYDETKKTHPRVVTIRQLVDWAKKYYRRVDVVSPGHFTHSKLNSSEHILESSNEAEVLAVCMEAR